MKPGLGRGLGKLMDGDKVAAGQPSVEAGATVKPLTGRGVTRLVQGSAQTEAGSSAAEATKPGNASGETPQNQIFENRADGAAPSLEADPHVPNPHPNPLPSDGRGRRERSEVQERQCASNGLRLPLEEPSRTPTPEPPKAFGSLAHRMGEGWGEGLVHGKVAQPLIPTWFFYGADLLLLFLSLAVAYASPKPLEFGTILFCAAAIGLGGMLSIIGLLRSARANE